MEWNGKLTQDYSICRKNRVLSLGGAPPETPLTTTTVSGVIFQMRAVQFTEAEADDVI